MSSSPEALQGSNTSIFGALCIGAELDGHTIGQTDILDIVMKSAEVLDHDKLYPILTNGERISQTHDVNGPIFSGK